MIATLAANLMKVVVVLALAASSMTLHVSEAAAATRSPKITLNQLKSVVVGSTYTVSGRLVNTGSRNNKTIVLQAGTGGTWRTIAAKKRQDDGRYGIQVLARTPGSLTLRTLVKNNHRVLKASPARKVRVVTAAVSEVSGDGPRPSPGSPAASANNFSSVNAGYGTACQISVYDVNADCYFDPYRADLNGNGYSDVNLVPINGFLVWIYDTNEDWRMDSFGGDTNGDLVPDLWLLDLNQDGSIEQLQYDPTVHAAYSVPQVSGGLRINIDHGNIPTDPPGMAAAVDGLLIPGRTDSMHICTFLASAGMAGSNLACVY